jgi:hypothetical protein
MNDEHIIKSGRFKGKRIEIAPSDGIERFREIANEFMLRIFDFEPGDYLLTDESNLRDFTGTSGLDAVRERVRASYDLDARDLESGNLLEILRRINALLELERRPIQ